MQYAYRIASPDTAQLYPMACQSNEGWQALPGARWRLQLQLPQIPAQHIIVPSFAMVPGTADGYHFQFVLRTPEAIKLPMVPAQLRADAAARAADSNTSGQTGSSKTASAQIDCWHSESDLIAPELELIVHSNDRPRTYLFSVTVRPIEAVPPAVPCASVTAAVPGTYSQMEADAKIRTRICSPTALSMALSGYPGAPDWPSTVQACYDPATRAYGVWPLAIHWASMHGIVGAVEACSDWEGVICSLELGIPVVCSIRFERGDLPAAPLPRTSGHLVLLYGIDGEDVLVKDPAAQNSSQVTLRYPADAFATAWLRRRGAAYFFASAAQMDAGAGPVSGA